MDEAGLVPELLPRLRLDGRVDVTDDDAVPLGDEDTRITLRQLRTEEPGVSARRIRPGRHEPGGVECVMHTKQRCAESPERAEVPALRSPDDDVG